MSLKFSSPDTEAVLAVEYFLKDLVSSLEVGNKIFFHAKIWQYLPTSLWHKKALLALG